MKNPSDSNGADETASADSNSQNLLSRRDVLQGAAWLTGTGLLASRGFSGHPLLALTGDAAELYFSPDRIAATPTHRYRPYRSRGTSRADHLTWVQIDLGTAKIVEEIRLFPANQRMVPGQDAYFAGEGFPVRFKLEGSEDAEFMRPQMILDFTRADFPNPKDTIVRSSGSGRALRYVRLTVTRLPAPECTHGNAGAPESVAVCAAAGQYWFALSKITVLANGTDVAVGRPVTCDATLGNHEDAQQLTRPVRVETEYVHHDRPENVTSPDGWQSVPYLAHAPVSGVVLEGGVFETTMRNNIRYLLDSFTLDDLLLQFRERAGKPIPPRTRKPDKFWEEDLAGSSAGRFLMGAGNTLRWIDDPELRERFHGVMDGIAECQEPDGYVMAYPKDTIFYSERGAYTRAWLTHGLIEAGFAGDTRAFAMLRANYDWFNQCRYLPELLRGAVQGGQGMIANTRMYFTPVGRPADMQVMQRYFLENDWLEALAKSDETQIWQYPYDRPHCYLLTNLEAYLDVYRATGDTRWRDGVKAAWEMYNQHWEQPGGSISIIEYNYDPPGAYSLTQKLGELCGSSFWVFLSQRFQLMSPEEERYATEIEKSIYNVAMANQQDSYGLRYHTILVGQKEDGTRKNTCCEGQGTRLIGSLPEHIYSIAPDGLYVQLFEPSTISWQIKDQPVSLRMETKFPFDRAVKLTFTAATPQKMKLRIRVPSWSRGEMAVSVNGEAAGMGSAGSYLMLNRTWSSGDTVTFALDMGFEVRKYTGTDQIPGHSRYSLTYGPLLYAAIGPSDAVLHLPRGARPEDLGQHLQPKPGSPLHFTVAGNPGIVYMPYWQVSKETFTCFPVIEARESDA
jgi:uncharacterized protein